MAFLTHPNHGAMHAPESTVPDHQANGWVVSTPQEWVAHKTKQTNPDIDATAPRKPGRPRKE